ncbi:unnamed protein product [Peniophora sp. CBMAI 1063]|nr:unnamed protein product [Peniophora sp. CBMAI 1063]
MAHGPPPGIHDPAGLAIALSAMGLGDRRYIENQANQHSYVYGNFDKPLEFSHDWPAASVVSQGERGGWARAIRRRHTAAIPRPASYDARRSPLAAPSTPSSTSDRASSRTTEYFTASSSTASRSSSAPSSASATPNELRRYIRQRTPVEFDWMLRHEPAAMIACMVRAELHSWHGRWFVVRAGCPPGVTNSIAKLHEMAGGVFVDGLAEVYYAGEQLTAYDMFCVDAIQDKLKGLSRGPGDNVPLEHKYAAVEKAREFARRWPWLPRYVAHCESTKIWLSPPVNAGDIIIEAIADDGWEERIATHPLRQRIPGRDDVHQSPGEHRCPAPPPSSISTGTRLGFDGSPTFSNRKHYVVFVGRTVGVFATE